MGTLTHNAVWEDVINQIETTDELLGGAGGPLNIGMQQLSNRTEWLKQSLQGYSNINPFSANRTFVPIDLLYSLALIDANGATLSFILPDSADIENPILPGFKVTLKAINVNKSQVAINAAGSDKILDGSVLDPTGLKTVIYLGDGETVQLVLTELGWLMVDWKANFGDVGGVLHRYKQLPNSVIAQGQLLNRADYPRLWEYAQTLGTSLISDFTWLSSVNSHGFFSSGNTTTTFRVPDLRGMFIRSLDLSAGIDLGRPSNKPGDYEADDLKAHNHQVPTSENGTANGSQKNPGWSDNEGNLPGNTPTSNTGGLETRPKNIGLLPLILT
jgi:hypothetical protein